MKVRRFLLAGILILLFLPTLAYAHPGRTDSNGGHTDSSTGEYHYHHGYEAHQHSDINGDGIADCPYSFVNATNRSSSNSSSTTGQDLWNQIKAEAEANSFYDAGFDSGYQTGYNEASEAMKKLAEDRIVKTFWLTLVSAAALFIFLMLFSSMRRRRTIQDFEANIVSTKSSCEKRIEAIESKHTSEIEKLKIELAREKKISALLKASAYNKKSIFDLPDDVTLEPFFTPVKGHPSAEYPYGEYTVFLSKAGKRYHSRPDCAAGLLPYHCFDVIPFGTPCMKCVMPGMYPKALPEWTKCLNKNSELPPAVLNTTQETVYYTEAANGMTVRVPESRLEAWQAEQDRLRDNPESAELTEAEKRLRDDIVRRIYGPSSEEK